jgi:hypothetical protein
MGRIGMYWHAIKDHHADFAPLVVAEFAKNRLDPVRVTEPTAGGKYRGILVDPRDLQSGSIGVPECLEDYPTTWPQRKDTLMNILQGPMGQAIGPMLKNADEIKRTIGISGVQFPGESQYKMEMNIIELMLGQQPLPPPPMPPPPPPMAGMPPMPPPPPPPPQPSIPFDPLVCDPPITLQAFKDWAQSEDGQKAAVENQAGYMNVRLRAQQAQMAMAPPPPPPGAPQGPGGPPPGGAPGHMAGPNAGGPGGPPPGPPGGPPAPPGKIGMHHGPPGASPLGPEGNHAPPPNPQAAH